MVVVVDRLRLLGVGRQKWKLLEESGQVMKYDDDYTGKTESTGFSGWVGHGV
jgi:hypothetical protein